ncbi:transposase family protein [Streptomyces sp. NPDC059866]|uniref:transposase family protein n=1 Tax=Streptomyces sp. NPDC059866 TaxID=3346978 RepID=UPI0036607859
MSTQGNRLDIEAQTRDVPVACPSCGTVSARRHSVYRRRLADTTVGGQSVEITLTVRRLSATKRPVHG